MGAGTQHCQYSSLHRYRSPKRQAAAEEERAGRSFSSVASSSCSWAVAVAVAIAICIIDIVDVNFQMLLQYEMRDAWELSVVSIGFSDSGRSWSCKAQCRQRQQGTALLTRDEILARVSVGRAQISCSICTKHLIDLARILGESVQKLVWTEEVAPRKRQR